MWASSATRRGRRRRGLQALRRTAARVVVRRTLLAAGWIDRLLRARSCSLGFPIAVRAPRLRLPDGAGQGRLALHDRLHRRGMGRASTACSTCCCTCPSRRAWLLRSWFALALAARPLRSRAGGAAAQYPTRADPAAGAQSARRRDRHPGARVRAEARASSRPAGDRRQPPRLERQRRLRDGGASATPDGYTLLRRGRRADRHRPAPLQDAASTR